MKKVVLASVLLLLMGSSQAAESPKWDGVSVSYLSDDFHHGYGAAVGIRSMVTSEIELSGSINYVDGAGDFV
jgi:hypothetical protein